MHARRELLHGGELVGADHGLKRFDQLAPVAALEQGAFGGAIGVTHFDAHEEAVELGLRQRKGADQVMRILRGDDEKRLRQFVGHAVGRDLAFFHGLEQRALGLGRGAVDLVGEHQLREDRTRMERKAVRLGLVDRDAQNIGRQQVAGELDALEVEPEDLRQRVRERGLADAGEVLDEQVPAREQAGERQTQLRLLPENHLADALDGGLEQRPRAREGFFRGEGHIRERRKWGI